MAESTSPPSTDVNHLMNHDDTNNTAHHVPSHEPGAGWSNGSIHTIMYPFSHNGRVSLYQSTRRWIQTSTSWSRTAHSDPNDPIAKSKSESSSDDSKKVVVCPIKEGHIVKSLMGQLSEKFQTLGWKPGTGGGISIRLGDGSTESPYRVFSTPSGIQKEDMIGDDVFELDMDQNVIQNPKTPGLKLSSMTNLWFIVYKYRPTANCVIHTHSMNAQLATLLDPTESSDKLQITHLEMIKGVGNHAYDSLLEIPIINNQPSESLLAPDMERAIQEYPKCNAVLVRRHGVYVWGDSWEQAKTQLESFDYLFESAVKMRSMGIDFSAVPSHGNLRNDEKKNGNNIKRSLDDEEDRKDTKKSRKA